MKKQLSKGNGWGMWIALTLMFCAMSGIFKGADAQLQPVQSPVFEERVVAGAAVLEPLVPMEDVEKDAKEDARLDVLVLKGDPVRMPQSLAIFVKEFPQSRWRAAIEFNLGKYDYQDGKFTSAIRHFQTAYGLSKNGTGAHSRLIAAMAAAQLCQMYARLGRMEDLDPLLKEAMAKNPSGRARVDLEECESVLATMKTQPGFCFRCGPMALARIREALGLQPVFHPVIQNSKSTYKGFSLAEVEGFARQMNMDYVAVKAPADYESIPVPCVIHWKQNHYAAAVSMDSPGKYLVRDITFGFDAVMDLATIKEEGSGYFLVSAKAVPATWSRVGEAEAQHVFGRGLVHTIAANCLSQLHDIMCRLFGPCHGMAEYGFFSMMASLCVKDSPVGYSPPVGPAIPVNVYYNQLETVQPGTINYSNMGSQWGFNWQSWVEVTGSTSVILRDGGAEVYSQTSNTFPIPDPKSGATLAIIGTGTFTRSLPDGSSETYSVVQSMGGSNFRSFLSDVTDAAGNNAHLSYDTSFRILSITDAIGQQTTFTYGNTSNSYLVTQITDPFTRSATFGYNASGQLTSVTDVEGITSSFTYDTGGFLNSMTTPYGATHFAFTAVTGTSRTLSATDPLGRTEMVAQMLDLSATLSANYPSDQLPPSTISVSGSNISFLTTNNYLYYRNSFYWSKKAYADAGGLMDYSRAVQYHWLHTADHNSLAPYLESIKQPLESWVFFNYSGQTVSGDSIFTPSGTFSATPNKTARLINIVSGTHQFALTQTDTNLLGNVTRSVDPLGRETKLTYASNLVDLVSVQQKNSGGGYDTLFSGTYNSQHLPTITTGPDGKSTSYTWNSRGQVTSVTDPLGETTSYTYDADGYLQTIDPPLSGTSDQITFTYDGDKRVQSRTQWGYTVTYSYDALDRITQVSYPDGTTEQTVYNIMEVQWRKDRLGHWTRFDVDADQHIVGIMDPANDYTAFEWCKCGSLDAIVDANGNTTRFGRDVEGRVTSKTYADGHGETYSYSQYSGWPELATDAKGQTVTTQYALDGRPVATLYSGGTIATSNIALTWDARYSRVTTMIDGTGTTGYTYEATGTDGAGQIASVDGPLGSDTITYTYDDLGRVTSHAVNGTGESVTFDALGRVATVSNPLDAYTLTYDGSTSLLTTISGSSSFTITNTYDGTGGDYRLLSTGYAWSGTQSEGAFAYQYDAGGRITQWNVQAGSGTARQYNLGYDPVSRLTSGLTINPSTSTQIAADAFLYDRVGNRLGEQQGQMVSSGSFNVLNQLLAISAGGNAVFRGSLNEPGTVASGSTSARTDGNNNFALTLPVTVGTNAFTLVATDINGNATTNTATVVIPTAGNRTYTYDLNGNLTSDGEKTYEWDEADQLVAINYTGTTTRTQFTYDGLGRRVEIKELNSGTTIADTKYVWDGMDIAEARASDGTTVQKRFFAGGFQSLASGTANYYYIRDHLGSIRGVFDGTGGERGQWSYDLFGNRSLNAITSSPVDSDFGYTGHFEHTPSALVLTLRRPYAPAVGRWLSRDPLGEGRDATLYSYVWNDPINLWDPYGLCDDDDWATEHAPPGLDILANVTLSIIPIGEGFEIGNLFRWLKGIKGAKVAEETGGLTVIGQNQVSFQGMEVKAVRDLSHIDNGTLEAMQEHGFAPSTVNGDQIVLHHLEQNPAGPLVEMPAPNHSIWNDIQHPFGNTPGVGLTAEQRTAYNAWRADYWKARAAAELSTRSP